MEATAALQSHPADGCRATKEELVADGLQYTQFCTICLSFDVKCHVANHPSATGFLILFIIVPHSKFCIIYLFL
jgi:hypothetical protein